MYILNGINLVRKFIRDNIWSGVNGSDVFISIYFVIVFVFYLYWFFFVVLVEWNGCRNEVGVGEWGKREENVLDKLGVKIGKF